MQQLSFVRGNRRLLSIATHFFFDHFRLYHFITLFLFTGYAVVAYFTTTQPCFCFVSALRLWRAFSLCFLCSGLSAPPTPPLTLSPPSLPGLPPAAFNLFCSLCLCAAVRCGCGQTRDWPALENRNRKRQKRNRNSGETTNKTKAKTKTKTKSEKR